jgi:hypothetical protein
VTQAILPNPAPGDLGGARARAVGRSDRPVTGPGTCVGRANRVASPVLILAFIGVFLAFAVRIRPMVDASGGATQWNARHGILG